MANKPKKNEEANSSNHFISIRNVSKNFGSFRAVDNVSLNIQPSDFFALLGGSGCGKTTLLRMLAGFETPDSGEIIIDGQDMANISPADRPVNMMFQSYALFPHMTVMKNIGYGLRYTSLSAEEQDSRVREMLSLVQLEDFAQRKPHQLSGGQKQRVALARALARRPKLLLLDEPLAALDKKLREETGLELVSIQENLGTTFVVVTHDQAEALTMAGTIGVMDKGRIVQVGSPRDLYEFPANRFVAGFIGNLNMLEGKVTKDEPDHVKLDCPALGSPIYVGHGLNCTVGQKMWFAIRPEKVSVSQKLPPQKENVAKGVVENVVYVGNISHYGIRIDSGQLIRVTRSNRERHDEDAITKDTSIYVHWTPHSGVALSE